MKKKTFLSAVAFILAGALLALPLNNVATQNWQDVTIDYEDTKDKGKLAAEYKVVRQKRGCRLTIRLTNTSDETISHYWFKFTFKEGHKHENRITDHLPGSSEELTYASCGAPRVHISEVE